MSMWGRARERLDQLREALLAELSNDPVERAAERMAAARERGGIDGMIKATAKRAKATKDHGKLQGIRAAIDDFLSDEGKNLTHSQMQALVILKHSIAD
jgi:membrane carboxypeptidase/penicillin-binding protein PbpC